MNMSDVETNQKAVAIADEENKNLKSYRKLSLCKESTFDLEKYNKQDGTCNQIEPKTVYDSDVIKKTSALSNRYKNLKPSALSKIYGERPKYEYLKKIAVSRVEQNLQKQLMIFSQIVEKKEKEEDEEEKEATIQNNNLTHGIFSWNWNDFLERRKLKSFVWVDILLRMKENRLHSFKYQKDLRELQLFVNKIFSGFFSHFKNEDTDIQQHIAKTINEAKKALFTLEYLEKEFSTNSKEFQKLFFKDYLFIDAKRNSEEKMLKSFLENRLSNSYIIDPIEVRYQINWFNNVIKQNKYRTEKTIKTYEDDISRYREMESLENLIDGNCLDFCYSSIEDYKFRIAEFQHKYDKELDEMETKLSFIRLQIEKLIEQRNWLSSEIERFHYEEQEMRLQMEKDKANEVEQKQGTFVNA